MTNNNRVTIYFSGLETREKAIFERVIAFNSKQGNNSVITDKPEDANLFICSEECGSIKTEATSIIVSDKDMSASHLSIKRPVLITKAMNVVTSALEEVLKISDEIATESNELAEEKQTSEITTDTTDTTDTLDDEINNAVTTIDSTTIEEQPNIEELAEADEDNALHALVIDDSAAIRKQLELELRDAGITSDFAESGEQALEKIKDHQFDLVFLDIIMPGIDGYETCKAMRATAEYKKVPIIMLSGKTSPLDEVQGVIAGATTYLTKPVKSDKLQETLNRVSKWINNFAQKKSVAV